jgi:hypothetical protein
MLRRLPQSTCQVKREQRCAVRGSSSSSLLILM